MICKNVFFLFNELKCVWDNICLGNTKRVDCLGMRWLDFV